VKYFITYLLFPCEREMLFCAKGIMDREMEGIEYKRGGKGIIIACS